jgi:hypothetical protein
MVVEKIFTTVGFVNSKHEIQMRFCHLSIAADGSNPLKIFLNSIFLKFETLTLGLNKCRSYAGRRVQMLSFLTGWFC